ncbi:MAG: SGNH/GDSL hydrolase family protein [Gammaproteobacteria bacterium]|nr:SGNH/GDSL hydrolase family protein [Gammaproteobacteria bacterium]
MLREKWRKLYLVAALSLLPMGANADVPWQFAGNTRFAAFGDSLAAGVGAIPMTQGYTYLLYQQGVFDAVPNTLFTNAGVPGATSEDVLLHQAPMVIDAFTPSAITLTVGGNDLLSILDGADPGTVLFTFQTNLSGILSALCFDLATKLPPTQPPRIFVSNLYTIPDFMIPVDAVVGAFNLIVDGVVSSFATAGCNVRVANVFSAFLDRDGLLLIKRNGAGVFEVHPTNAGHRAMAAAFKKAIKAE